jgi:hypothetical protein
MESCLRYSLLLEVTSQLLLHPEWENMRCFSQGRLTRGNGASRCVNYFIYLSAELGISDGCMVLSRRSQFNSVESSVRPRAPQTSAKLSPLKIGNHSNWTSRSVFSPILPPRMSWKLT